MRNEYDWSYRDLIFSYSIKIYERKILLFLYILQMINYSKYQKGCCEYDTLPVSNFITLCEFLQCMRLLSIPDHGL